MYKNKKGYFLHLKKAAQTFFLYMYSPLDEKA